MSPSTIAPSLRPTSTTSHEDPLTRALSALRPGESGVIRELALSPEEALRFIELGFAPGESVRFVRRSPLGDPIEVEVMGVRQGIRVADAARIRVESGRP